MPVIEIYGFARKNLLEGMPLKERIEKALTPLQSDTKIIIIVIDSEVLADEGPYLRLIGTPDESGDLHSITERLEHLGLAMEILYLQRVVGRKQPDRSIEAYLKTNYEFDLRRGG